MAVEAVIFDWGGTLTPWHDIDHEAMWLQVCTKHYPAAQAAELATAVRAAEIAGWRLAERERRSTTLADIFARGGLTPSPALLASYFTAWEPHTWTDPDVGPLFREIRGRGIKVGVLSNTMWSRDAHEQVFLRDDVLALIDGAVYSSEIPWVKPHPEAFQAAMAAVGITDPASCVFVGDRPWDDIHGAKSVGMRAVLVPNSTVPPFDETKPDAIITRLSELVPLLDSW